MDNIALIRYSYLDTKTLLNSFLYSDSQKQILDSISCIIRLALLTFKEMRTKFILFLFVHPRLMKKINSKQKL